VTDPLRAAPLFAAVVFLGSPQAAAAQSPQVGRPHVDVSLGAFLNGGIDFGQATASLTANEPSAPEIPLFRTTTTLGSGPGLDGRLSWLLTRSVAVEGGASWSRQTLETAITADAEDAPDTTASEEIDSYVIEGGMLLHLSRLRFAASRGVPFVSGGGGYLRQLDGDSLLLGTGSLIYAGGGLKYFLGSSGTAPVRGPGVRLDARIEFRTGGLKLDAGSSYRASWRIGAAGLFRF
jgi:hypothetical protein